MNKNTWYKILGVLIGVLVLIIVIVIILYFLGKKPRPPKDKKYKCVNYTCQEDENGTLNLSQCKNSCKKPEDDPFKNAPILPNNIKPGSEPGEISSPLNSVQGQIYKDPNIGGYVTYMPKNMLLNTNSSKFSGNAQNCTKGNNGMCSSENLDKGSKNHGSSLAEFPDGTIMAAWFSGVCEGYPKVDIQYSLLTPGSLQWTKKQGGGSLEVPGNSFDSRSNQNAVLHYDKYNNLMRLLFPSQTCNCQCDGLMPNEAYSKIYEQDYSNNNWSDKYEILKNPHGQLYSQNEGVYIKNKVVQFDKDTWWIPGYIFPGHSSVDNDQQAANWETKDGGKTYTIQYIGGQGGNAGGRVQPSVFNFNGKWYAFTRDRDAGVIWYSIYNGNGNWENIKRTNIKNNNSGIQGMTAKDGSLFLILNPQTSNRNILELWRCPSGQDPTNSGNYKKFRIEEGPDNRDFSYPWIIEDKNGMIQVSYTLRQRHDSGNDVTRKDGWFIMWRAFPRSLIQQKLY